MDEDNQATANARKFANEALTLCQLAGIDANLASEIEIRPLVRCLTVHMCASMADTLSIAERIAILTDGKIVQQQKNVVIDNSVYLYIEIRAAFEKYELYSAGEPPDETCRIERHYREEPVYSLICAGK